MSQRDDSPCWGPRFWRTGSLGSSCSGRCDWTSRPRLMRWSQKRKSGCWGLPALQTLQGLTRKAITGNDISGLSNLSACEISALILAFRMLVTKCWCAHVTQTDGAFTAAVDKRVALVGVELSGCDHLRQLLHVGGLYIHDVWHWVKDIQHCIHKTTRYPSSRLFLSVSCLVGYWSCGLWSLDATDWCAGRPPTDKSRCRCWPRWNWCGRCGH